MHCVSCDKILVRQLLGSDVSLRLLIARVVIEMLVENGRVLSVYFWWTDTAQILLCRITTVHIVCVISVKSRRVEVVNDAASDSRVVIVRHGWNSGGRTTGD